MIPERLDSGEIFAAGAPFNAQTCASLLLSVQLVIIRNSNLHAPIIDNQRINFRIIDVLNNRCPDNQCPDNRRRPVANVAANARNHFHSRFSPAVNPEDDSDTAIFFIPSFFSTKHTGDLKRNETRTGVWCSRKISFSVHVPSNSGYYPAFSSWSSKVTMETLFPL